MQNDLSELNRTLDTINDAARSIAEERHALLVACKAAQALTASMCAVGARDVVKDIDAQLRAAIALAEGR